MKSHKQERGGVVSFIIITLALAGLLSGGLYLSKHQARVARESSTGEVAVVETQTEKDASKETVPATDETSDEQTAAVDEESSAQTTPGRTSSVATTGPSQVVAAGPTDVVATTIGLMALAATSYAFLSSRRTLVRSALKRS